MQRKLVSLHTDKEQATEMKLVDVSNKPDCLSCLLPPSPVFVFLSEFMRVYYFWNSKLSKRN
jgi:hypothetical protein